MITPINTWLCRCSKCHHQWNTRTANVPERCANVECKKANWNDDYEYVPEPVEVPVHSPAVRPVPVTPTPTDKQSILSKLQADINAIENRAPIVETADIWIEDKPTFENGEKLYWHHQPKKPPVCYKREVDWDFTA